jgi:DAACS family dicarboxylate/amino acid:cation (Na+ or H+) symporter
MIKASLGLVLTIDRPLDMARTTVNVFGDTVGAVVIARSEGESAG